jgi:hypothetical protein
MFLIYILVENVTKVIQAGAITERRSWVGSRRSEIQISIWCPAILTQVCEVLLILARDIPW